MYEVDGKRAIITAASSGIGYAVASVLAESGASVLMSSHDSQKIKQAANNLKKNGLKAYPVVFDLSESDAGSLISKASDRMGGSDILIMNYGDPKLAPFLEITGEEWDMYYRMFIRATTSLVREFVPQTNGWGRIVFITSMTTRESYPGFSISGSLRAAVVNLGKTLSLELGKLGITVNSISQGYFLTERLQAVITRNSALNGTSTEEERRKLVEDIPSGRIGRPEEIGYLVRFLCSEEASYINGANIPIDGGLTRYPY